MQLPVVFLGILVVATLIHAASIPSGSSGSESSDDSPVPVVVEDTETTTVDTSTDHDADVGDGYDTTTTTADTDSDRDDNVDRDDEAPPVLNYSPGEVYDMLDQMLISPCYTHSQAPLNIIQNLYGCLRQITQVTKKVDLFNVQVDNVSFANLPFVRQLDDAPANGLQALMQQLKDNAPQICMNSEPVMQCVDTYLQACFPPATPSNDTSDDAWLRDVSAFVDMFNTNRSDSDVASSAATEQSVTTEQATTENASPQDAATNDSRPVVIVTELDVVSISRVDDTAGGFFGVPFLKQADQISRMIRQAMQILCESNQDLTVAAQLPAEDFLDQVPCMIRTANDEKACPTDKLQQTGSDMDAGQNPNTYCRTMELFIECYTQEVGRRCSRVSGEALQMIGDQYMQAITPQCQPPAAVSPTNASQTQWSQFPEFTAADNITASNGTGSLWDWIFLLF